MKRRIDARGYVRIGGAFEHRLVMEQVLGRRLRFDEHVHHRNGDKADNRPENLELVAGRKHTAHHNSASPKRKRGVDYPGDKAARERRRQREEAEAIKYLHKIGWQ